MEEKRKETKLWEVVAKELSAILLADGRDFYNYFMNKYSYRPYKKEFPQIYQNEKELIQQNIKGDYKLPRTESPRFSAVKVYKKLQKTLTHHSTYPAEDCNHLSIHPPDKIGGFSASDYKIEHIGSTAIPGLGGKGIIDIMIGTKQDEMMTILNQLEKIGYIYIPQANIFNRLFLQKLYPKDFDKKIAYHVHITNIESEDWQNAILFRDYLRTHKEDLEKYAKIKKQATSIANEDRDIYMKTKEGVIKEILKKAIT